jgi:catechol 2,3-dioxygenase-like lactoylglutathione lyase family enzyme
VQPASKQISVSTILPYFRKYVDFRISEYCNGGWRRGFGREFYVKPTLSHVGIYVRADRHGYWRGSNISDAADLFEQRSEPTSPARPCQRPPAAQPFSTINQLSFKVATLPELRAMYQRALTFGVEKLNPINHGNAISIYFDDPEGNKIEVYYETEWYLPQPLSSVRRRRHS